MRRRARIVLQLVFILVVVGLLPVSFGPAAPGGHTPYLSTMSDVFVVTTLAAPSTCEFKDCAGGSRHNIVCAKVDGFRYNCSIYHGFCLSQSCPP